MRGIPGVTCLLAVVWLAAIAGCGRPDQTPAGSGGKQGESAEEKPYTIGVSQCHAGDPWLAQMDADIRAAAEKHPNLTVVFKDAENDAPKQCAQVREFVASGVDLMIVSPKDPVPLTEPVAKAIAAGIPVIVLGRPVVGEKYSCFITANNKRLGKLAGEWLVEKLGGKGRIVELKGLMTSALGQERHEGFREALRDYPDIRIIFEADTEKREANAQKEMEEVLARFSQIEAVFAHHDASARGAYLAAKAAGRQEQILFVGIDAVPQEGRVWVAQGMLTASFQYPTGGAEAVATALKILSGQKAPKKIVLGSRLFTAANVKQGGTPIE